MMRCRYRRTKYHPSLRFLSGAIALMSSVHRLLPHCILPSATWLPSTCRTSWKDWVQSLLISHELALLYTTFPPYNVASLLMQDARILHPMVTTDFATCYSTRASRISQPIEGTFDHHLLLLAVEFTNTRRGHRILVASVVY